MTERKMATIRRINKIEPIPDADKIVKATVGGWQLVTAIDNGFKEGDLVVYCEIDSWIPTNVAPFLTKPGHFPKEFNGVQGEKLRTIKLRGQVSQGLLLPLTVVQDKITAVDFEHIDDCEGMDVSELLGIQKYEPPIAPQLAGLIRGNFPSQIPKTDQERIQNIKVEIQEAVAREFMFEVTEKLEGSSMTCYMIRDEFGVCSRNLDLKRDENNSFWRQAIEDDIEAKMKAVDENLDFAIQGELVGPGIQGNIYKLTKPMFFVFDVYDIQAGDYLKPEARQALVKRMGLNHVPVLATTRLPTDNLETLIAAADGKSVLGDIAGPNREGLVYKQTLGGMTFKIISNKYLLGQKD